MTVVLTTLEIQYLPRLRFRLSLLPGADIIRFQTILSPIKRGCQPHIDKRRGSWPRITVQSNFPLNDGLAIAVAFTLHEHLAAYDLNLSRACRLHDNPATQLQLYTP